MGHRPVQRITATLIDVHERVIDGLAPESGDRWLDVVTGLDLAPALIDTANERAREQALEVDYVVGDCEAIPF